ncbi:MAG TPA: DUF5615 family PIN-like protein [Candidatus Paceibacterota bacterium]
MLEELRKGGYDAKSILESNRGTDDETVLRLASEEGRILVTLDRDFGRLVFLKSQRHVGVIFMRLSNETPQNIFSVLLTVLENYGNEIQNKFLTVSESGIRIS